MIELLYCTVCFEGLEVARGGLAIRAFGQCPVGRFFCAQVGRYKGHGAYTDILEAGKGPLAAKTPLDCRDSS